MTIFTSLKRFDAYSMARELPQKLLPIFLITRERANPFLEKNDSKFSFQYSPTYSPENSCAYEFGHGGRLANYQFIKWNRSHKLLYETVSLCWIWVTYFGQGFQWISFPYVWLMLISGLTIESSVFI